MRRSLKVSTIITALACAGCAGDVPFGVMTEHGLEINLEVPDTVESGWWFRAYLAFTNHTDGNLYVDIRSCALTVIQGGRLVPVAGADSYYCRPSDVRVGPTGTISVELPFRAVLAGDDEQPVEPGEYILRSDGDYEYWVEGRWRVLRARIQQPFAVGPPR